MAKGTGIICSAPPRGRFIEGTVSGTPKPGTCMQVQAGTAMTNGRFTYEVYTPSASGDPRPVIVLLDDPDQGFLATTAYVSGTRCFLYEPVNGDELNMLVKDVSGTGDDHTIGERMQIDTGSGKLVTQGTSASRAPFTLLEAATDPTADALLFCMYNGSQGG